MKKILITIFAVSLSMVSFSQVSDYYIEAWSFLIAPGAMVINGDTIYATTQTSSIDTILATKLYVDGKAAGLDTTNYDSDYYFRIYLNGAVVDSTYIGYTYHSVYSDTATIALNGVDSIYHNTTTYILSTYANGELVETATVDSTLHSVYSDTATVALNVANESVFSIVLPSSTSVEGRIATPTSLPDGWTLDFDANNLIVTHNLNRFSANVTVKSNTSGTIWDQERNTAAYSYYSDLSDDEIKIYSLCTTFKPIRINIIFE